MSDRRGLDRLRDVVRVLRGEGGCPWDREQTLQTLKPFLLEEAYELFDAIDSEDSDRHRDELGDVLLQVFLQAQIRSEEGCFTIDDVADGLCEKLIRRHPHVFGDTQVSGSGEVLRNWETIKSAEKEGASVLSGLPRALPSLQRAQRVQSRASRVGFDWNRVEDVVAKVEEELREVREALANGDDDAFRDEIGDLLFAAVNLSRFHHTNAEQALDQTVTKFIHRFEEVERRVREEGRALADCTLDEMDAHWERAKQLERDA